MEKTKIAIQKEPKELFQEFRVYENCYFCQKPTNTWHLNTNTPVCGKCSTTNSVSDINKSKKHNVSDSD